MGTDSHHPGKRFYLIVWIGLLFLTVVEIVLAYMHLPLGVMLVTLMGLSLVKSALIVAYFMHLRFERRSLFYTLIPAAVICIGLLAVFFPDSLRALELRP